MGVPRKLRNKWGWGVVGLVVMAVTAAGLVRRRSSSLKTDNIPLFEVVEGPLSISVVESGTIQPRQRIVIKSQVEGINTVLYVIPEGSYVKKGELLVELDSSKFRDKKIDAEIRVKNAEAGYVSAKENLEVVKNQAQSNIEETELKHRFALEDLKNYLEGEYPKELKELQARIKLAEEELQRAKEKLHWSTVLFRNKYIAESELKADELAVKKAELELELARDNLHLLKTLTHKRKLDELKSAVRQSEMALERTRRKASADIAQAEATLMAKESEFAREKSKLQKIKDQIAKCKIVAPAEGFVVYATSTKFSWRGNVQPLSEGQQVREREELIYLQTGGGFTAEIRVHESSLQKIRPDMPATVTVEALPGRVFKGNVISIAPLPDPMSMFMSPDLKLYKTKIYIEGGEDILRSGMSCRAEIIVKEYPSAVYVPVQAVVEIKGIPYAYVKNEKRFEWRPVKLGLDNGLVVHILEGLRPGELVSLLPPLSEASRTTPSPPAKLRKKLSPEQGVKLRESPSPAGDKQ